MTSAIQLANQSHRASSGGSDGSRWKALSASLRIGAPAAYPLVAWSAKPWSRRSDGRGAGGIGGPASAASPASTMPAPRASRPANIAADRASRYVARAIVGSTASSSPAAASSNGVASLPRLDANAISARRRCTWARTGSSSAVLDSAVSERSRASSRAPAWNFACAAARARRARREGSGVRATARSRKAAAAAKPPRACARAAECSSSAATSSSGTDAAWARCHARRSGSISGSVASASARWTSRRSFDPAARRRPSEPADGGTPPGGRAPTSPPIRRCPQPTPGCRAVQPRATPAPDRRPDRRRRRAAGAAHRQEASPAVRVKLSSMLGGQRQRRGQAKPARELGRAQARAAAQAARAGSRASRRRSAPARAHPAEPAKPIPTAPAHRDDPRARREAPANRRARRRALVSRTRARSSPPAGGAPQRPGSARTHDRATARHQRHIAVAAPRRPRPAARGPPARPGTGRVRVPYSSPNATPSASRWGCGRRSIKLEERRAQLLKRRERKLHLSLDPGGAGDPKPLAPADRVLEQSGLADARLRHAPPRRRHGRRARRPAAGRAPRARGPGRATALLTPEPVATLRSFPAKHAGRATLGRRLRVQGFEHQGDASASVRRVIGPQGHVARADSRAKLYPEAAYARAC